MCPFLDKKNNFIKWEIQETINLGPGMSSTADGAHLKRAQKKYNYDDWRSGIELM